MVLTTGLEDVIHMEKGNHMDWTPDGHEGGNPTHPDMIMQQKKAQGMQETLLDSYIVR